MTSTRGTPSPAAALRPPEDARILLVRTSALGDVVHCLPVLVALRQAFPDATLGWVIEAPLAEIVEGPGLLDEVIPVRLKAWRRSLHRGAARRDALDAWRRLRRFRADVALDLMGNHKGGVLTRLSGARRRVGLARSHRREPSSGRWIDEPVEPLGPHAVERALAVLSALDLDEDEIPAPGPDAFAGPSLFPHEPEAVRAWFAQHPEPFALLHPGAGWGNKVYPPERWGRAARRLAERTGLAVRVALAPSASERRLAARIVEASGGVAAPLESGDLATLAAQLRRARLVLGGDTGPVHLAHALGTPVLEIMGPTDPAVHGPWGAPERALARRLPCSFCSKRMEGVRACLLALDPDTVAERAEALLERSDGAHR